MADPRFAVIVNPKAAGGKAIKKLPEISAAASSIAPEYMLHVTSSIEDARLRAREFANLGIERIVAVVWSNSAGVIWQATKRFQISA